MSVSALLSSSCALYDPIIILVMEPTTSHFPRSKSISHLTLRASPQIRLLSLVQSFCSGLQSDSLVCFRARTPLLCLSRARPRRRPSPPTPQQRRCPSWITTHRWVMDRRQLGFLQSSWIIYFLSVISLLASLEYHEFWIPTWENLYLHFLFIPIRHFPPHVFLSSFIPLITSSFFWES